MCDQELFTEEAERAEAEGQDQVLYRCRPADEKLGEDSQAQRGRKELQELRKELQQQTGIRLLWGTSMGRFLS